MIAELEAALAKATEAQAALRHAGALAQDAVDLIRPVGVDSVHEADYEQITARWAGVVEMSAELARALDAACRHVEKYMRTLAGTGRGAGDMAASAPTPPPPASSSAVMSWADQQRAKLPTYVTSGIYVDPDGNTEIVQSGQEPDGEHQQVADHLRQRAFPAQSRGRVTVGEHVEGKVAWRQRQGGVNHVEVVINNRMCAGEYSCRELLPYILLPGQTLVVHDPKKTRTFRGRSTW